MRLCIHTSFFWASLPFHALLPLLHTSANQNALQSHSCDLPPDHTAPFVPSDARQGHVCAQQWECEISGQCWDRWYRWESWDLEILTSKSQKLFLFLFFMLTPPLFSSTSPLFPFYPLIHLFLTSPHPFPLPSAFLHSLGPPKDPSATYTASLTALVVLTSNEQVAFLGYDPKAMD